MLYIVLNVIFNKYEVSDSQNLMLVVTKYHLLTNAEKVSKYSWNREMKS